MPIYFFLREPNPHPHPLYGVNTMLPHPLKLALVYSWGFIQVILYLSASKSSFSHVQYVNISSCQLKNTTRGFCLITPKSLTSTLCQSAQTQMAVKTSFRSLSTFRLAETPQYISLFRPLSPAVSFLIKGVFSGK